MSKMFELLGKSLALAGFLFTVATYAYNLHVDRQNQRYKEATALIEQYNGSGIRGLENELTQRLLYYNAGGYTVNDPASYSTEAFDLIAKETLFGYTGVDTGADTGIKPFLSQFLEIMDFYARVGFCLDAKICDADITRRYFCPRASAFEQHHRRLIAYYQDYVGTKGWSDELDRLNRNCDTQAA